MSLMSKLLSATLIATLSLSAASNEEAVIGYIKNHMVKSSRVKVSSVDIIEKQTLDDPKGWDVYFVNIHANIKKSPTETDKVNVPETVFVKDGYAAPSLINIETGADYKKDLRPKLNSDVYDSKHLIAGNKDAKHKLVIFSDPQCPFCQDIIPKIYKSIKENPKEIALYYYHLPLLRIHPVSDIITRVMIIEQNKGNFDKAISLYSLEIDPREVNATKVLDKINKDFDLKVTEKDIDAKEIADELKHDQDMATKSMVAGTPTIYVDGIWDKTRKKYKELLPKEEEK